jgi:hypothetical protein
MDVTHGAMFRIEAMMRLAEDATLDELLADPLIVALMRSDGVSEADLRALLARMAERWEEAAESRTVVAHEIAAEEAF